MKRALVCLTVLACTSPALAKKSYDYYLEGDPADVVTSTTRGTVLMGGGTDVDAAFQWLCQLSGGGDFLVIRATGTDAYNPYIRELCQNGNSVATLIVPSRAAASDPAVINLVDTAEALWIAGGDQSNYVNDWQDSLLEEAINAAIARGVPVGGTSAGRFNLGRWSGNGGTAYTVSAINGVLTSTQPGGSPY